MSLTLKIVAVGFAALAPLLGFGSVVVHAHSNRGGSHLRQGHHHDHHHHHHHHHGHHEHRQLNDGTLDTESEFQEGDPVDPGVRCGRTERTKEQIAQSKKATKEWKKEHVGSFDAFAETVNVPTIFHILRKTNGKGGCTQEDVEASLQVLNDAYQPEFHFELVDSIETLNSRFYKFVREDDEYNMTSQLHQGGPETLNVYAVQMDAPLGFASYPEEYEEAPEQDGVVIDFRTMPGGIRAPYNEGDTLTHEVGHWFGLDHPFARGDGNCDYNDKGGDLVADTPPQAVPDFTCSVGRDTCPEDDKVDQVRNFMDYNADGCIDHFTAGQRERMVEQWLVFRDPRTRQIPTLTPTQETKTHTPTSAPTVVPIVTADPTTLRPSASVTTSPTSHPTSHLPTGRLSSMPESAPTSPPSFDPSSSPTSLPSSDPTTLPTSLPTSLPSFGPTNQQTSMPSSESTSLPTSSPTSYPTAFPTTAAPSSHPTSRTPTATPSFRSTFYPSPSRISTAPFTVQTSFPSPLAFTQDPTSSPTSEPSSVATTPPIPDPLTVIPTVQTSNQPTSAPETPISPRPVLPTVDFDEPIFTTGSPASHPTSNPTSHPTSDSIPTSSPTSHPTLPNSIAPTHDTVLQQPEPPLTPPPPRASENEIFIADLQVTKASSTKKVWSVSATVWVGGAVTEGVVVRGRALNRRRKCRTKQDGHCVLKFRRKNKQLSTSNLVILRATKRKFKYNSSLDMASTNLQLIRPPRGS